MEIEKVSSSNKSSSNPGYSSEISSSTLEELRSKDKPIISVHSDADGLVSGSLLSYAIDKTYDDIEFLFPSIFGQTDFELLQAGEPEKVYPDVILDQAPVNPDYDGLVVDHHGAHFQEGRKNNYELVFSPNFCTSRILYERVQDQIPEDKLWMTALGMAGDGREDEVPQEIFIRSPDLLTESGYTYGRKYGSEIDYTPQHSYVMAKSLINYGTRLGESDTTLAKLMSANNVLDIVHDSQLLNAKKKVKSEIKNLYGANDEGKIEVYGYLAYIEYKSDFRLWIAQDMYSKTNKTSIALNKETNTFSIRGPLAGTIARMLNEIEGISSGGHGQYSGGRLETKSSSFLRQQVPILDREWKRVEI